MEKVVAGILIIFMVIISSDKGLMYESMVLVTRWYIIRNANNAKAEVPYPR